MEPSCYRHRVVKALSHVPTQDLKTLRVRLTLSFKHFQEVQTGENNGMETFRSRNLTSSGKRA